MSFNKITVVGNLGKDPDLRYTPDGTAVATISVATNEKIKSTGEEKVTWFRITLWRAQAEAAAKYLAKGSPIYIEGRLRIEEWTDRDNKNRYTLDVQASEMQFIGGRANSGSGPNDNAPSLVQDFHKQGLQVTGGDPAADDDPPF